MFEVHLQVVGIPWRNCMRLKLDLGDSYINKDFVSCLNLCCNTV